MHVSKNLLNRRLFVCATYGGRVLALFASFLLLSMSGAWTPAYAASTTNTPTSGLHTFLDPIYGFSLNYPSTWTLTAERNGSHITLLNPVTRTTISPIVTTQSGTPAAVLKQALPARSSGQQTRIIAGHPAIDYLLPYVSQPQTRMKNHDAADIGGPQQTRQVITPVTNTANTTNVYTFLLTQPTSATGKISAAEQADQRTFEAILTSFTLPTKVVSTHAASATANATGCDRVCWADANVDFADYTATSTVNRGDGQPNYQCAEFVARAITQDGMIPGLNNGGANGNYSPASDDSNDGYGYGGYLAHNGNTYHLWNVGVANPALIVGLHDYLMDSGLATNIGEDMSQAQPGDVIFFNNGSGTDYYHTMIIVAVGNGGVYLDGHNVDQYHRFITSADYAGDFDLYHFKSSPGFSFKQEVYTYVGHAVDGRLEVYARGSNNNIWHRYRLVAGGWSSWQELQVGGLFNGNPAVGIDHNGTSNQLQEVFARGRNNNIWHIWQTSPDGPWYKSWQELPTGHIFQGTPAVGYTADGRLEVYARDDSGKIWHSYQATSGGWSPWQELQVGGLFNGDPAVGIDHNGTSNQLQEVFARGRNNNIWHIWQTSPDGPWYKSWQELPTGHIFQGTPAVGYTADGRLEVYARDDSGKIWHSYQATSGGWAPWQELQVGGLFNGDPVVGNYADGRQEVFARGRNNNIWHIWQTAPNGSWSSAWQPLQDGLVFQGTPAISYTGDKTIEVFARDSNNNIEHNWQVNGNWRGWTPLQTGGVLIGDPAVVSNSNGSTEVFAVGANHDLWHIWKSTPGGSWISAWQDLAVNYTFQGTPAAQMDTAGSEEVFAIDNGTTNSMWHNWQEPNHNDSWSGWNQFDGQSGFQQ